MIRADRGWLRWAHELFWLTGGRFAPWDLDQLSDFQYSWLQESAEFYVEQENERNRL
jgi:hypothetical protein